jgi:hypothetical protein
MATLGNQPLCFSFLFAKGQNLGTKRKTLSGGVAYFSIGKISPKKRNKN